MKYLVLFIIPFYGHSFISLDYLSDDGSQPNCERVYEDNEQQENCKKRRQFARLEFIERVESHTGGQAIQCANYSEEGEGLEFVFKSNIDVKYFRASQFYNKSNTKCTPNSVPADVSYNVVTLMSGVLPHWKDRANINAIDEAKVYCWNSLCGTELAYPYCETVLMYKKEYNSPVSEMFSANYNQYIESHIRHPYDYFETGFGEVIQGNIEEAPYFKCNSIPRLYTDLKNFVDQENQNAWWDRILTTASIR